MTLLVAGEVGADALMVHGVPEFYRMPPPTTIAVDLPPPWFDLALNQPGRAVRDRARVEYDLLCQRHTKVGAQFLK